MKKILLTLLIITLLSPFTVSAKIAISDRMMAPTSVNINSPILEENTEEIIEEIIEEIQYDIYFSPTCYWCQKLDSFLESNNGFDLLNINKIDVNDHAIEFNNVAESLGASAGTPFVVYEENGEKKYIDGGYYKIVDYFSKALNIESPISTPEENSTKRLYVIILGLLLIVGPLAYLGLKK